jgi:peptide subunit release factor 1 (eRF1)
MNIEEQELIDKVMPKEIKEAIIDIQEEFIDRRKGIQDEIEHLTDLVQQAVLIQEKTVRGDFFQAVYRKGGIAWDTDRLLELAVQYPEILEAKGAKKASVIIVPKGG